MEPASGLKAIVIGAGIGGLSAAISLRRAGAQVTVFERMPELREVGSGLTLWVNAMRSLEKLGAADSVRERGAVVERLDNRTSTGKRLSTLPLSQMEQKHGAPSVAIHRGVLQATLAKRLDPPTLQLGVECTGFEEDGDGVAVRLADGRAERADVLVGADGIYSTIRSQLFGRAEPRYSGYTCWRSAAKLDHEELELHVYHQLYGTGSNFGIFPIGDGTLSWYGTSVRSATKAAGAPADWKRQALDQFRGWWSPVTAVIEATDEAAFAHQDIYDRVPIETWGRGQVTLVGDAAHPTTPALGQGGCMAIEDAVVLGRNLAQGEDIPAALRGYEAGRRKRANGIVRMARRQGNLYHGVNPFLRVFRDYVFLRAPERVAMSAVEKLMGYEA